VGLVKASTTVSNSYVAVGASNPITLTFTSACPATTVTTTNASLMDGFTQFQVAFAASETTGACAVTFTAGSGTGSCSTAAACSVTVSSILISALSPTRFNILRPSAVDNGVGSSAAPLYAHAGRKTLLRVQQLGLGADGKTEVAVTNCPTCSLVVSSTDCNFASSPISSTFTNDVAEVGLTFPDNGAATYTCSITVKVLNAASVAMVGPDRTSTSLTYLVTVCKSAAVKLLTNTTSQYRGQVLQTGVAYEFYAIMVTAAGAQCWGDSQDSATTLTLSAVDAATGKAVTGLSAVNVNATSTTTTAFLAGNVGAAASTSVQVVGGAFRFQVVFTNSSVRLGLKSGIKLQIAAASLSSTVTTGALTTAVAAAQLRFARTTQIPAYAVKTRPVYTGPNFQTAVTVVAVDALPTTWQALGLTLGAPNVASGTSEFGNAASVFWRVAPSVAGTQLPLTIGGGASTATLSAGTTTFSSVAWSGPDGSYAWTVQSATSGIAATPAVTVYSQAASTLRIPIAGFTTTSTGVCSSSCVLPNKTFVQTTNTTISATAFLSVQVLQAVNISVQVSDSSDAAVLGDSESILAVTVVKNVNTTVQLAAAPAFATAVDTLYARVVNGTAVFSFGLVGSTLLASGTESFASLSFSCPATKPSSMLATGESSVNPCSSLASATTRSFQVVDPRVSAATVRASAAVRSATQVFKLSQSYTSAALTNITDMKAFLATAFAAGGVSYLGDSKSAQAAVNVQSCLVTSQFNGGDLGSTVCTGSPQACSQSAGYLNCPNYVLGCQCNSASARTLALRRYLLQNASSVNASATATEMYLDLTQALGFPATSEAAAVAEYTRVQAVLLGILKSSTFQSKYGVTGVSTRSATVVVTAIPTSTVAATTTPASNPVTSPATPATTPTVSSASPLAMALALLLAALLALVA